MSDRFYRGTEQPSRGKSILFIMFSIALPYTTFFIDFFKAFPFLSPFFLLPFCVCIELSTWF